MDDNNLYELEISPKEIIQVMKKNIYQNNFKNNHQFISSDYLINRAALFSLVRKISNKMCFKSQTYFLSIHYLDILFSKNKKIDCNYKTLGLACLLLSAKFIENDPFVPNLQNFIKVYNMVVGYRYIISVTDLFYAEVLTCKMLGYKLNYYTIYDFNSFFFGHGIIKMEQLRDLNNRNHSYYNNHFEINSLNSNFIKRLLEKIYKKSRNYLELIVNNTQLCLKYNSLIISIFIMKKAVEEILYYENLINKNELISKDNFLLKTSKNFKELMLELYKIDYESINSYKELISDTELKKLFHEREKVEMKHSIYNIEKNINFSSNNYETISHFINDNNEKKYHKKQNTVNEYSHINYYDPRFNDTFYHNNYLLNTSLIDKQNLQKINLARNLNNYNENTALYSQNSSSTKLYRLSTKPISREISNPKKYNINTNYLDISNLNSNKDLNSLELKRLRYRAKMQNRASSRHSDIICFKYLQKFTNFNEFGNNRETNPNSVGKKNIRITSKIPNDEIYSKNNTIYINDTIDINNDSPIKFEKYDKYNYYYYKKMNGLKRKVYKDIYAKNKDYSISLIDRSNTVNTMNTINAIGIEDINNTINYINKNRMKPYFKKVIRNTSNQNNTNMNNPKNLKYGLPQKTKTISSFSLNNNKNNKLKINLFYNDINNKEKNNKEDIIEDKSNIDNSNKSLIKQKKIFDSKKFNQKYNLFNMRKNAFINITDNVNVNKKKDNDNNNKNNNDKYEDNIGNDYNLKNKEGKIKDIHEDKNIKKDGDNENILEEKENNEINKHIYSNNNLNLNNRNERRKQLINRLKNIDNKTNNNIYNNNKNNNKEKENNTVDNSKNMDNSKNNESSSYYNRQKYKRINKNESKSELSKINNIINLKSNVISNRRYVFSSKKPSEMNSIIKESNTNSIDNSNSKKLKVHEDDQINKDKDTNTKDNNNISKINNSIRDDYKFQSIRYKYINKNRNKKNEINIKENDNNKDYIKEEKIYNKNILKNKSNKKENDDELKNTKINKFNKDNDKEKKNIDNNNKDNNKIYKNEGNDENNKKDIKDTNIVKKYYKSDAKKNYLPLKTNDNDSKLKTIFSQNTNKTSSIFKLLNEARNLSDNLELSKNELNFELPNNFIYNNDKSNIMDKDIKIIDHNDIKDKNRNYENKTNKETLIPKHKSFNSLNKGNDKFNKDINSKNSNDKIINSYHYRNIYRNKYKKITEDNKKIKLNTNNASNVIVINNNININFNNKIKNHKPGKYIRNRALRRNITDITNNNYFYNNNEIIINKGNNNQNEIITEKNSENYKYNNKTNKNYYKGGTVKCFNSNNNINNQNNSISNLIHRLPFYKKTLENNRKILSMDSSIEINQH